MRREKIFSIDKIIDEIDEALDKVQSIKESDYFIEDHSLDQMHTALLNAHDVLIDCYWLKVIYKETRQ